MRVFNETKTVELTEYDLNKGYLKADRITTHIPEVHEITVEQKIQELTAKGIEVEEVNGIFYEVTERNEKGNFSGVRIKPTPAIPEEERHEEILVYVRYTEEDYPQLVEKYIREKYTLSAELAILRQRDVKTSEFDEYYAYAEKCKERAKVIIYG